MVRAVSPMDNVDNEPEFHMRDAGIEQKLAPTAVAAIIVGSMQSSDSKRRHKVERRTTSLFESKSLDLLKCA